MRRLSVVLRKVGIVLLVLLGVGIVLLAVLAVYHRIALRVEEPRLAPPGQLVEVDGHIMHVHVQGDNEEAPILVLMAGGGVAAPVYDFKPLSSLLSSEFRVAIVEKVGYGYSDIADVPRDIDTMLSQTREALALAGAGGPYVLLPHSMSGIEAFRWAQLCPEEVAGIVGIDPAVPSAYTEEPEFMDKSIKSVKLNHKLTWLGVQRFPFLVPVSDIALTPEEFDQAKMLTYRDLENVTVVDEAEAVARNAQTVLDAPAPKVPLLTLIASSNGIANLAAHQEEYTTQCGGSVAHVEGGHFLHQSSPERVRELVSDFVRSLGY